MKLERVEVSNFLRLKHLDLPITTPITLIAGRNEAGKSTIIDAVRFALTGVPTRVRYSSKFKKDLALLVHDGEPQGAVSVQGNGFATATSVPNGKLSTTGTLPVTGDRLEAVLTPGWFNAQPVDARREFLFSLLGIRVDKDSLVHSLVARGHDPDAVKMVSIHFGTRTWGDIEAMCKEAASQQRGVWKSLTGEDYGERKAETWVPKAPEKAAHTVAECTENIRRIEGKLDVIVRDIMRIEEAAKLLARVDDARKDVRDDIEDLMAQQDADEKALEEFSATLAQIKNAAAGGLECPECKARLTYSQLYNELRRVDAPPDDDPDELKQACEVLSENIRIRRAQINAHHAATALLAALPAAPDGSKLGKLREDDKLLRDQLRSWQRHLEVATDAERYAAEVETLREKVKAVHRKVVAFTKLADDVGPNGLPAQRLSEGLGEFNGRLGFTARLASWPTVTLTDDMDVLVDGRPYSLASESAQWRADCLIAEACAFWSTRMFVLDRVDVLDVPNRLGLIKMLATLAANQQIETVILAGTFKQPPTGLPSSVRVQWIEAPVTEGRVAA